MALPRSMAAALIFLLLGGTTFQMVRFDNGAARNITLTPEYKLHLGKVVMSISASEKDLTLHDSLIKALPEYALVYLLLPDSRMTDIRKWLEGQTYAERVELVAFPTKLYESSEVYFLTPESDKLRWIPLDEPKRYPHGTTWAVDRNSFCRTPTNTSTQVAAKTK